MWGHVYSYVLMPVVLLLLTQPVHTEWSWVAFKGRMYSFVDEAKSWADARLACQQNGGDLIQYDTTTERTYVEGYLNSRTSLSKKWWIGVNDLTTEGDYRWPDGTAVTQFDWFPGLYSSFRLVMESVQPSDASSSQNCVELRAEYYVTVNATTYVLRTAARQYWNDAPCSTAHGFICEKTGCGFEYIDSFSYCKENNRSTSDVCRRKGFVLNGYLLRAERSRSSLECAVLCQRDARCRSANYRHVGSLCQLNTFSPSNVATYLTPNSQYQFMASEIC